MALEEGEIFDFVFDGFDTIMAVSLFLAIRSRCSAVSRSAGSGKFVRLRFFAL